jgi:hypothetical protein
MSLFLTFKNLRYLHRQAETFPRSFLDERPNQIRLWISVNCHTKQSEELAAVMKVVFNNMA